MTEPLQRDFEDFVLGRSGALMRLACLLVGDSHHAQDLVQETLWRTHRHWRTASGHPEAYARTTLTHLAYDRRRHLLRRVRETVLGSEHHPPSADSVAQLVERDALMRALAELPARQRATVVLRFWEDLSVEDTAALLRCTTGTVKSTTSKALSKLRDALGEEPGRVTEEQSR